MAREGGPSTFRLTVALLLLSLSAACATTHGVRLDTGEGEPQEYRLPTSNKPGVSAGAFEEGLMGVVLDMPLRLRPAQPGALVRASYPGQGGGTGWQRLMSRSFDGFCKPGQRRGDCLSVLDDVMGLGPWDKLGVALALSLDPLKESISRAVESTLAPQLFYTVIATGLISWVGLAANPEPVFTKAAAIVSAVLLFCLGVETFLELVNAGRELKRITDRATTLEELEQAGQRFADRVGPEVARVFVLAVTVVVSYGMAGGSAWLASRLSMLPSLSEALTVGGSGAGISLASLEQVSAVAVSAEGVVTIALPASAVAMAAGTASSLLEIEGPEHHIATDKWLDATHSGGPWTPKFKQIFDKAGMSMDDPANRVRLKGHKGPHPQEYHEYVFETLGEATRNCRGVPQCRASLTKALERLAEQLKTEGSYLNKLVTRTQ